MSKTKLAFKSKKSPHSSCDEEEKSDQKIIRKQSEEFSHLDSESKILKKKTFSQNMLHLAGPTMSMKKLVKYKCINN
jgi:hypothetical protein